MPSAQASTAYELSRLQLPDQPIPQPGLLTARTLTGGIRNRARLLFDILDAVGAGRHRPGRRQGRTRLGRVGALPLDRATRLQQPNIVATDSAATDFALDARWAPWQTSPPPRCTDSVVTGMFSHYDLSSPET